MDYANIRQTAKQFKAITSLTVDEFDELLPKFDYEWECWISKFTLSGKPRSRRYTPKGRDMLSEPGERLFFILSYFKTGSLQEYHAGSFGMKQDMCNKWIHVLTPLLEKATDGWRPGQGAFRLSEGQDCALDGTESPTERPQYGQYRSYSGKKKAHTYKHLLLVALTGAILWLSPTAYGSVHDKSMADAMLAEMPSPCRVHVDLGFLGYRPAGAQIVIPHKKPKGGELTKMQKAENKRMSSQRVFVEHAIGHVKTLRIIKDKYRNRKLGFKPSAFKIAVNLHNFRCQKRRTILL